MNDQVALKGASARGEAISKDKGKGKGKGEG